MDRMRKVFWFEKFDWFVSSENYLIIAGRNSQQNEVLVKKYLLKTDLYMHADIVGSASTVIKNPSGGVVPPITLQEAACFSVARSNAWTSKVLVSAYWVYAN